MTDALATQGDLAILEAITRLAVARGAQADDVQLDVYADTLRDLSPFLIRRACDVLAKRPRREYETALPSCGEIRDLVQQIARDDADADARNLLAPLPQDEQKPFCNQCFDETSGWRINWCPGDGPERDPIKSGRSHAVRVADCGHGKRHHPHEFADRCPCYATNPVIAKRRAAEEKRRQGKAQIRQAIGKKAM